MMLTPITLDLDKYPAELRTFLSGAKLYDSSCSPEAKVILAEKDCGYFIKNASKGSLEREAVMTRYYHKKGLSANVLAYLSVENDWLVTERIQGDDCTAAIYLEHPKRLCDTLAERLTLLHAEDFSDCPVPNHTERYLAKAAYNKRNGYFDKSLFPDNWGYASAEEAWTVIEVNRHKLETNTLLHGDYCLPNILLENWRFNGYIDLDNSGVGDRHVDLFWAVWSLNFNLKTERYRGRFIDAYGRGNVDEEKLRIIAAVEVFG